MADNRYQKMIIEETEGFNFRLLGAQLMAGWLPYFTGGRYRSAVLRLFGFQIGRGTIFWGMPRFIGGRGMEKRLSVGQFCHFNVNCFLDLCGPIEIGDSAGLGPEAMLITGRHEIGPIERREGPLSPAPITICDGAWIGARALILPGVTVGTGAIVAAGAVVTRDVPPNTVAAGIPAKVIREIEP